ncbi:MAG: hypothetical protein KA715_09900 [Xanthomonadaceae bacterium]|nr:hypothetical protein [Xanthomonadaceae bacterium]
MKPKAAAGVKLPSKLFLVKVDADGKRLEDITFITDDGTLGDMHAGDGYYSRKLKLIEREAGMMRLALISTEKDSDKLEPLISLEVMRRPSFLQILQEVWIKIRHPGVTKNDG